MFRVIVARLDIDDLMICRSCSAGDGMLSVTAHELPATVQNLETGFARDLSLTELAAQGQLSPSHFARAFRQSTGHTPHQYLLRVCLSHARKLLTQESEGLSLSDIAMVSCFR